MRISRRILLGAGLGMAGCAPEKPVQEAVTPAPAWPAPAQAPVSSRPAATPTSNPSSSMPTKQTIAERFGDQRPSAFGLDLPGSSGVAIGNHGTAHLPVSVDGRAA